MGQKLSQATFSLLESMLFVAYDIVCVQVVYKMVSKDTFEDLYYMRCNRNWTVVGGIDSAIFFMDGVMY